MKISSLIGFSFSKIDEYVYKNTIKESQLEWKNFKPFIGIDVLCAIRNFFIDLKVQSAIPVTLGNITDKDFLISEENVVSMFSSHDLITDKDYSFNVDLSYKIVFPFLELGLGLSSVYSNIKMEAIDGYLQYPIGSNIWTGDENKEYINGAVISYEQSRFLLGLLAFFQKKVSVFSFVLTGVFYPLVRVNCIDNHFLRSVQFLDFMKSGFSYSIKSDCIWNINEKYKLFFSFDFIYLKANGTTCINPLGIIVYETTELDENYRVATTFFDMSFILCFEIKI